MCYFNLISVVIYYRTSIYTFSYVFYILQKNFDFINNVTCLFSTSIKLDFDYDKNKFNAENPIVLSKQGNQKQSRKRNLEGKPHNDLSKKKQPRLISHKEKKRKDKVQLQKIDNEKRQTLWDQLKELEDIRLSIQASSTNVDEQPMQIRDATKSKKRSVGMKKWKMNADEENMKESSTDTEDYSSSEEIPMLPEDSDVHDISLPNEPLPEAVIGEVKTENKETNPVAPTSLNSSEKTAPSKVVTEPKHYVLVERSKSILRQRRNLPILNEEFNIMEALAENDIIFLIGSTGSGKSTQVPQFLYEAGYTRDGKRIGVSQPRRIAATNLSSRVAEELNLSDKEVSYHVRFDKTLSSESKIIYMTDGILLQIIKQDLRLSQYSAILVDEAHERSAHTDICLALLCLAVSKRRQEWNAWMRTKEKKSTLPPLEPLKLVIMSATLNIEELSENPRLFQWMDSKKRPPVIEVEPLQKRKVLPYFNKTTPLDYMVAAYQKVCKLHREAPPGHILVFVTGASEVKQLCAKLKQTFNSKSGIRKVFSTESKPKKSEAEVDSESSESDGLACVVLPLYSALDPTKQAQVFKICKPRSSAKRVIIVSTNVAETSLTIPHITYVVDTGRVKRLIFHPITGLSSYQVDWCSRASAIQRAGRAGRTAEDPKHAGKCYYLFTSYRLEQELPKFEVPEIMRRPVDDVLLTIKSLWRRTPIYKTHLPSLPDETAVVTAENRLLSIGALTRVTGDVTDITQDGVLMEHLPVSPRFARMILASYRSGLLDHVILLVACLSVQRMFSLHRLIGESDEAEEENMKNTNENSEYVKVQRLRNQFVQHRYELLCGDLSVILGTMTYLQNLVHEWQCELAESADSIRVSLAPEKQATLLFRSQRLVESFGLRFRDYQEVEKIRKQLYTSLQSSCADWNIEYKSVVPALTKDDLPNLREIIFTGIPFNVARKMDYTKIADKELKRQLRWTYETAIGKEHVRIHSESVLNRENFEYVAYLDSFSTSNGRKFVNCAFVVDESWLTLHGHHYCSWTLAKTLQPIDEAVNMPNVGKSPMQPAILPLPHYCSTVDSIVCYARTVFYGSAEWPLVTALAPLPLSHVVPIDDPDRIQARWIARLLLQGDLFPILKKWRLRDDCPVQMLTMNISITRASALLLINSLHNKKVKSKHDLIKIWSTESAYLLSEVLPWFPENCHQSLTKKWPPLE